MTQYDELRSMQWDMRVISSLQLTIARYTAELYPTLIRSRAVGCCSVMARYK